MLSESQERLLQAHRDIDLLARTSALPFISGWETTHGIDYEHLAPMRQPTSARAWFEYNFMADDELLAEKVRRFHRDVDGVFDAGCDVFVGAGSSPLLSSIMVLMSQIGVGDILYVSPIYHAYYQLAKILRLNLRRIGQAPTSAGEVGLCATLPDGRSVLLLTDPSWISGHAFSEPFFLELRDWQRRTGSLVIVDGTFQYTKWAGMGAEWSSRLLPDQTFRIVCPTKSLCVHGVRCAYMILPRDYGEEFGWYYCKLVAATSIFDIAAARLMLDQLLSPRNNRDLVSLVRHNYDRLI